MIYVYDTGIHLNVGNPGGKKKKGKKKSFYATFATANHRNRIKLARDQTARVLLSLLHNSCFIVLYPFIRFSCSTAVQVDVANSIRYRAITEIGK